MPETAGFPDAVARWRGLCAEVDRELRDSRRPAGSVAVMCVTKTRTAAEIEPLLAAGARVFGENRVQEAAVKWPALKRRYPEIALHLIGPLQTNKVDEALVLFDVVKTLDRPRLAEALAARAAQGARLPELYVQINIGSESQKSGVAPGEADEFLRLCRDEHRLTVAGLMCIPPVDEQAAPYFALLAKIAERNGLTRLSMGMTNDFEIAVQLGSTEVRIGSAIFGERG
jgi:PLP dependent protein